MLGLGHTVAVSRAIAFHKQIHNPFELYYNFSCASPGTTWPEIINSIAIIDPSREGGALGRSRSQPGIAWAQGKIGESSGMEKAVYKFPVRQTDGKTASSLTSQTLSGKSLLCETWQITNKCMDRQRNRNIRKPHLHTEFADLYAGPDTHAWTQWFQHKRK